MMSARLLKWRKVVEKLEAGAFRPSDGECRKMRKSTQEYVRTVIGTALLTAQP